MRFETPIICLFLDALARSGKAKTEEDFIETWDLSCLIYLQLKAKQFGIPMEY